jgi:excinuclease ABC subunit B
MFKNSFELTSPFKPAGDQPRAIDSLVEGLKKNMRHQTLLGVTGSGKTFTMANVIQRLGLPTLVIAHNKTLAAQLAQEYREFFPKNAVHYFVSYYDYYQPEAYIAVSDTYIEKEASINQEIERFRHAATQALLTRRDVIIVASVSCIYGLGNPDEYLKENMELKEGMRMPRAELMRRLISMHFERTRADLTQGTFRATGDTVEVMPMSERAIYGIEIRDDAIFSIAKIDPITRALLEHERSESVFIFPAKHFITERDVRNRAVLLIKEELKERLKELESEGKIFEAERLKRRTNYDVALIKEVGYCNGIENYSRPLSGRAAGEPPDTLLSYFPHKADGTPDFLTIIDESHVAVPQIAGMYEGDASRKRTLVEHGFRLPSAKDNRPLKFLEFTERVGSVIYTSATPGQYELERSGQVAEQIIRPTGLIDPELTVRGVVARGEYGGQIADFLTEAEREIAKGSRVIATTLTKKMAEDLSEYVKEKGIKAEYLHSDIKTLDRIKILTDFRKGTFDCLIGVNLLREGLDLPEVSFIGILDADKEGFLRSETSLIQTIGRAARNIAGRVTLYADTVTGSMQRAMGETNRRRSIQVAYNQKHGITPQTIIKRVHDITDGIEDRNARVVRGLLELDTEIAGKDLKKLIVQKERQMNAAVKTLDFETAALLRDELRELEKLRQAKK